MYTSSDIARCHLGIECSSFEIVLLVGGICYGIKLSTAISHTVLASFSVFFCNCPYLMSDFITFWASKWSVYITSWDDLSIFDDDASASSTVASTFFSDYATDIHKVDIFWNFMWFKMSMVFECSGFVIF